MVYVCQSSVIWFARSIKGDNTSIYVIAEDALKKRFKNEALSTKMVYGA